MNKGLVKNLDILCQYYKSIGDKWRYQAYHRAISTINSFTKDIAELDSKELENIPSIGRGIRSKIEEYLFTGEIQKVKDIKAKKRSHNSKLKLFTTIWGVGEKKAEQLYQYGLRTITDVHKHKHLLTRAQKIGLQYYNDLLKPLKRKDIEMFKFVLKKVLNTHFGPCSFRLEIAGSYRRGKDTSSDIDCLITSTTFNLSDIVDILHRINVISEVLCIREEKFMGIASIPGVKQHFRLDIEFLPKDEWGSGLLYFTGSKWFNITTRAKAKEQGLVLNQHGLFDTLGQRIPVYTEKDILTYIGIRYITPKNR
jgi:DNA polymerase/3'-5' exonuclease PolX